MLKDIRLAEDLPFREAAYLGKIITFQGLLIKTRALKKKKKYWVNISAEALPNASDEIKERARDIANGLSKYAFEINEKAGKKLTCDQSNLLEGAGVNACA